MVKIKNILCTILILAAILAPFGGLATGVGNFGASAETVSPSVVTVENESELRSAIDEAAGGVPYIIKFNDNIRLEKEALIIPGDYNIRLESGRNPDSGPAYMLIGAYNADTIYVNGTLTLGGVTVTHDAFAPGRGVFVASRGKLIIESGGISGNAAVNGSGGGVYAEGCLEMYGGAISNNYALNGGGVYIPDNGGASAAIFGGAAISNNWAWRDGGGIWLSRNNLRMLTVKKDAVFSGNRAYA